MQWMCISEYIATYILCKSNLTKSFSVKYSSDSYIRIYNYYDAYLPLELLVANVNG